MKWYHVSESPFIMAPQPHMNSNESMMVWFGGIATYSMFRRCMVSTAGQCTVYLWFSSSKDVLYYGCLVNCGQSYPTISLGIRRQTQQYHITDLHNSMMDMRILSMVCNG